MGDRAFTDAATDDDLAAMERELAAALAAGAIGFTTSRSEVCVPLRLIVSFASRSRVRLWPAGQLSADPGEQSS